MSELAAAPAHALTKKLGPLPGFVWVLVLAGAAYGIYWWKNRGAATTGVTVASPDAPVAGASDGSGGYGSTAGTAAGTYSGQVNTLPVGQAAVSTNAQWAATAGNALIAAGSDPSAVSNALAKYLNGGTLTAQEQALVNMAVKEFQLPPEGVLPVRAAPAPVPIVAAKPAPKPVAKPAPKPVTKAAPKPVPKPAPKPAAPAYHYYTVKPGDSLSGIAQRTWGRDAWQTLYADNRSAVGSNPNLIHPGLRLKVRNKL